MEFGLPKAAISASPKFTCSGAASQPYLAKTAIASKIDFGGAARFREPPAQRFCVLVAQSPGNPRP